MHPFRIFVGITLLLVGLPSLTSCALFSRSNPDRYAGLRPAERRIAMAMDRRDLVLGMARDHVRETWGEPYDVQVAGDEYSGNERWIYMGGLSSPGFKSMASRRIVYFESGRVSGWE